MTRGLLRRAALWLGCALALAANGARADTPVALFKSFAGNVNFVGTQVTMRERSNKKPCWVDSPNTIQTATLSGIPAGATIVSAQLYWAGSGKQAAADYTVNFEGAAVTAPAARQYFSSTIGSGYDYFSGAVDVTAQVAQKRNGDYSLSGLTINNGSPYCEVQGVLGGFSLLVVYSAAAEPFRVLNMYEGFQYFRYTGITVNLSNFQVPPTLTPAMTARLGHITWEGDATLDQNGEQLLFNGAEMTDSLNPAGNQFDSASNINGDTASYGIDFDAYTIAPSSGLFKAGQTTATTRYQSGQDMVLLSAEVVAMPNSPTADLSIGMSRATPLQVGVNTDYNLTVQNAGPSTETGPVTVTDSIPAGLNLVSAGGSGWSCSASGQAVSCSTPGPLAAGAALPAITLTLRPTAAGTYVNSATVSGKLFDNVAANNSASDTATATGGAAAYAFTARACAAGEEIPKACPAWAGPVKAGDSAQVYVTAVSGTAATVLSASADTTVAFRFSLNCVDPAAGAGVAATYAGATLATCSAGGITPAAGSAAWSREVSLVFPKGATSAQLAGGGATAFAYKDAGKVALNLLDSANRGASASFVVKPALLAFATVKRTRDNAPNPAAGVSPRPGFAKAGEAFTLVVNGLTTEGKPAPNFGNELAGTWPIKFRQVMVRELPAVYGSFQSAANGAVTGTFKWDEAGVFQLSPLLDDYLGAGAVDGADPIEIGRFYPDHFTTATARTNARAMAARPPFACLSGMACAADIPGAAYSGQPFTVEVTAIGAGGNALSNYVGADVTLEAFDSAGGATQNPRGGALSANTGKTVTGDPAATIAPQYALPVKFASSAPRALNWTAPTAIYLRAKTTESVVDASGVAQPVTISSKLASGSIEGGVVVVNGRLQLANAFGSELLKLPVHMTAQYWTGTLWDNNTKDNVSPVDYSRNVVFTDCLGALVQGSGTDNCNGGLLKPALAPALTLKQGAGTFSLPAPGRGKTGSAYVRVFDGSPPWLPSTRARVVYGLYKSPLIYLREVH